MCPCMLSQEELSYLCLTTEDVILKLQRGLDKKSKALKWDPFMHGVFECRYRIRLLPIRLLVFDCRYRIMLLPITTEDVLLKLQRGIDKKSKALK